MQALIERVDTLMSNASKERDELPMSCRCPFTGTVMENPCVADDGFTYEEKAFLKWWETNKVSPLTGDPVSDTLRPDRATRYLIENSLKESRLTRLSYQTDPQIVTRLRLDLFFGQYILKGKLPLSLDFQPNVFDTYNHRWPVSIGTRQLVTTLWENSPALRGRVYDRIRCCYIWLDPDRYKYTIKSNVVDIMAVDYRARKTDILLKLLEKFAVDDKSRSEFEIYKTSSDLIHWCAFWDESPPQRPVEPAPRWSVQPTSRRPVEPRPISMEELYGAAWPHGGSRP